MSADRRNNGLSARQYGRFFIVGVVVGTFAILLREVIARLLPAETTVFFSLSVVKVYALGIVASFVLHRRYTFRLMPAPNIGRELALFLAVALGGAVLTWLLSVLLRYGLAFDLLFGELGGTAAFALAALISSLATYAANGRLVFQRIRGVSRPGEDRKRND
ncbi:MAG: GtrA family protein [Gammaproteobacteria bacterium]